MSDKPESWVGKALPPPVVTGLPGDLTQVAVVLINEDLSTAVLVVAKTTTDALTGREGFDAGKATTLAQALVLALQDIPTVRDAGTDAVPLGEGVPMLSDGRTLRRRPLTPSEQEERMIAHLRARLRQRRDSADTPDPEATDDPDARAA